jgi:hypothetical protein
MTNVLTMKAIISKYKYEDSNFILIMMTIIYTMGTMYACIVKLKYEY